jgi:hypothetical protein
MLIGNFHRWQAGFTYMTVLFVIATMGVILARTGVDASQAVQREKEVELLFVGNQFRQAIGFYYERTPGVVKHYPVKLEDLLTDMRYSSSQHYLRKLYRDPMTNQSQWGVILAPDGGIMGVKSLFDGRPIKSTGFESANLAFEGAESFSGWQFTYVPQTVIR